MPKFFAKQRLSFAIINILCIWYKLALWNLNRKIFVILMPGPFSNSPSAERFPFNRPTAYIVIWPQQSCSAATWCTINTLCPATAENRSCWCFTGSVCGFVSTASLIVNCFSSRNEFDWWSLKSRIWRLATWNWVSGRSQLSKPRS